MATLFFGFIGLQAIGAVIAGSGYLFYKVLLEEPEMIEYSLGVRIPKGSKVYSTHQMGPRGGIYEWRTSRNGTQYKKY